MDSLDSVTRKPAPAVRPGPDAQPAPKPRRELVTPSGGSALVLQARALRHERFDGAAASVINDLALMLDCERVSLGLHLQGRMKVLATSSGADTLQRQGYTDALAAAMDEAVEQRAAIVHPMPPGSQPRAVFAHAELSRMNAGLAVCTMPIVGAQRVMGAFVFERRGGFDARALAIAKDAALFVGPLLEMKHRLEAPVAGRLIESVSPRGVRVGARARSPWRLLGAAGVLSLLVLALWPVTFRVVSPARVEGIDQRILAAPLDGFMAEVQVRPGDKVTAGQLLGSMDDRDLVLQRDKVGAEIAQLDKQYREALTQDEAAQIVVVRAQLEQAQAQFALAERELERAQLRAPFDGVLIAGDLTQSKGMPVQRGQALLTVAPALGFKVVAEVDERDVTLLREGQPARVLFSGLDSEPLPFKVTRIAPVAVTLDGRNVFEVEGRADDVAAATLRPGQRGIARVDIDERLNVQVWALRLGHWLRRTQWQLAG